MRIPRDAVVVLGVAASVPLGALLVLVTGALRKAARGLGLSGWPAPAWTERRGALWGALGVLGACGLSLLYAWKVEPYWVELTCTELPVSQRVLGQDRFRIVQLSDLHLTAFGTRERRVAELVREARPDLVVITGDFGHSPEAQAALVELGKQLGAPYGRFGVRGNDDTWAGPSRRTLDAAGIRILQNEGAILEQGGHRLCLAGQEFGSKVPLRSILKGVRPEDFVVFLHHMPDAVDELGRLDPGEHVDLFLCGHTHGGQVCLPLWGAVVTESKYHKKYESGLYRAYGVPMYVNRGVGLSVLPFRFLARPEVAVLDLVYRPAGP